MDKYIPEERTHGIVYLILDKELDKAYIGKKQIHKDVKLGKRELAKIDKIDKRKKYTKRVFTDWEKYCSSNKELKERIENSGELRHHKFDFIVLCECYDETALKYAEVEQIIKRDALNSEQYYNDNIQIRQIGKIKNYNKRMSIICG